MELVQIIYDILLFGGALLMVVIAVSYLLSKSKKRSMRNSINSVPSIVLPTRTTAAASREQIIYRKDIPAQGAVVFQIDARANRDLKILRKPTVSKMDTDEHFRHETKQPKRTNYNGRRYTIVNEDMKKNFKPTVINF